MLKLLLMKKKKTKTFSGARKERNQKKNSESSWGKRWQTPSSQGQGGLSSSGWESADETAMYILPCFFPSTILLSSDLVKHPTLVVSSYHSLPLYWLKYINQVQMKHIHWAFNFCAHLCQIFSNELNVLSALLGATFGFLGYKLRSTKQEARKAAKGISTSVLVASHENVPYQCYQYLHVQGHQSNNLRITAWKQET